MTRMQPVKLHRIVPVVLSMQEAAALIAAACNVRHQAALSVDYGAGLRASEVCRLKVGDVDSQRMALRVEQGEGGQGPLRHAQPDGAGALVLPLARWPHSVADAARRFRLVPGMNVMNPLLYGRASALSRRCHR